LSGLQDNQEHPVEVSFGLEGLNQRATV
jgi:hypothetical protein